MTDTLKPSAGIAASGVIERIAAAQSSDPTTDDLTVPLAIELAEKDATIAALVKALEDVKQETQISGKRCEERS